MAASGPGAGPCAEGFARLLAAAMPGLAGWSAGELRRLLDDPQVFLCGDGRSAALGRVVADDAELLMLATDPNHRRQGLARLRLRAFEAEAVRRGAAASFLEVDADNAPACALYLSEGYESVATRRNYYKKPDGSRGDAWLLRKILRASAGPRPEGFSG